MNDQSLGQDEMGWSQFAFTGRITVGAGAYFFLL